MNTDFQNEILKGLLQNRKNISPKFLYDKRGSELFEQICELKEYYPVHAETEILARYSTDIANQIGSDVILIEPGCGNCLKVQALLANLATPRAYLGLDISEEFLLQATTHLQNLFPEVPVYPVVSDYTQEFTLPDSLIAAPEKRVVFFPGSTIGNLHPHEAKELLERMGALIGENGGLLIGVDRKKETSILELAYDDPQGVTAEFNYNLLDRLNRECSARFDRDKFHYEAHYNDEAGRVEMFLVSEVPQSIPIGTRMIHFDQNETIHTEDSYKYSIPEFVALGESAGFKFKMVWTDSRDLFGVYYFNRI